MYDSVFNYIFVLIYCCFTFSEERKWRKWVDEVFVHTLSPNVYRTIDESYKTFNWFSEVSESVKNEKCGNNNIN